MARSRTGRHPSSGVPARLGSHTDQVAFSPWANDTGDRRHRRTCVVCGGRVEVAIITTRPHRWERGTRLDRAVCVDCVRELEVVADNMEVDHGGR